MDISMYRGLNCNSMATGNYSPQNQTKIIRRLRRLRFLAWFKIVHRKVTDDTEKNNPLTPFFKGELGKCTLLFACPIYYP
ncbi:MAG: hypothetical protein V1749_03030, partial [Candidatus Desantisbacteria bacterium]